MVTGLDEGGGVFLLELDQRSVRVRPCVEAALFDTQARVIHRHATPITGDPSLADDIVSLTFPEAWRLRAKVTPEGGSPRPRLFGIAVDILRNCARAARRHQAGLARIPACKPAPDLADEVVERSADAQELAATYRASARLRRSEHEVFTVVVWAGARLDMHIPYHPSHHRARSRAFAGCGRANGWPSAPIPGNAGSASRASPCAGKSTPYAHSSSRICSVTATRP
ncbi:RNA polymerase subunit sigma-70 [Embleya sp. NPDC001921]